MNYQHGLTKRNIQILCFSGVILSVISILGCELLIEKEHLTIPSEASFTPVTTMTFITPHPSETIQATSSPDVIYATPIFAILPTPTARIFDYVRSCTSIVNKGQILFMDAKDGFGGFSDLYIMNGEGCFPRLIMKNVSGAPAWSPDGIMIAVGCEQNTMICILDTQSTLESCTSGTYESVCKPSIINMYALPDKCSIDHQNNRSGIASISWSSNMEQMIVTCDHPRTDNQSTTRASSLYVASLAKHSDWQVLIEGEQGLWATWSPKNDRIAVSNRLGQLRLLDPDRKDRVVLAFGWNPEWSPDGERIAFIRQTDRENSELFGIASIKVDGTELEWLYAPVSRDHHYWPPQNISLDFNSRLAWSPDGNYIASSTSNVHMFDSQIIRLGIGTGDLAFLTTYVHSREFNIFFNPDWGR